MEQEIINLYNECLKRKDKEKIGEITKYVFDDTKGLIYMQNKKWGSPDIAFEVEHFLSDAYAIVNSKIDNEIKSKNKCSFKEFVKSCKFTICHMVNNYNRALFANKKSVLMRATSYDQLNDKGEISNLMFEESLTSKIEEDFKNKHLLDSVMEVISPLQKTILVYRLKDYSFSAISKLMKMPAKKVTYLFYSIKKNPEVMKLHNKYKEAL